MKHSFYRGEIYYADLNPIVGSEQGGIRPVLILQNNVGNHFASTVIVAAITSRIIPKQSKKVASHRIPLASRGQQQLYRHGRRYEISLGRYAGAASYLR